MNIDFLSLTLDEAKELVREMGHPAYRAEQIRSFLVRGIPYGEMTNLPKSLREELAASLPPPLPVIREKFVSAIDGTVKYLFALSDGNLIESVVMKYHHGNTICISSQVGCRMGCRFCASTLGGRVRDLSAGEMLGQIIMAQKDTGERISGVVMMGIGEPLDNYDNVIRFLDSVGDEKGLNIGYRHISLSTCGVVPRILDLAKEKYPITLSISLHASDNETRDAIMPINRAYPIEQLLSACREYFKITRRRISFEYTLIAGKNDSVEQANRLADLLWRHLGKDMPFHVNLIPLNPVRERSLSRSGRRAVDAFARALTDRGINATVRRKLGPDIDASCGQLRHRAVQADGALESPSDSESDS